MGVIPERKEYKNFTYESYLTLSEKAIQLGFKKVTHNPYSEKNHFDKTGLLYDGKKVVLVYDVKANMLTVTAQEKAIKKLSQLVTIPKSDKARNQAKDNASSQKRNQAKDNAPSQKRNQALSNKRTNDKKKEEKEKNKKGLLTSLFAKKDDTSTANGKAGAKNKEKQPKKKALEKEKRLKEKKNLKKDSSQKIQKQKEQLKRQEKQKEVDAPKQQSVEQQKGRNGTYSVIADYYPLSFAKAMHRIRNDEEVKINTLRTSYSKNNSDNRYVVIAGDKQCEINYDQEQGVLDVSGEATCRIKEVFLRFGGREVYSSITANEKLDDYVIILKNKMPSALEFLSTQEKNDLASGLRELEKAVDHYEYSMFLLSPFKGLENFIFDLLKSKNIAVKMIGQAYEKSQNGAYVLKESYQNRCGVVYSEVMASLYEEYFATRNFYAHADVNGSHNIGSKKDAIAVVNKIYKVIEYNCKKLAEINFRIVR